MVISNNLNAVNAGNRLNVNVAGSKKASEKLSSGLRINRAADDASGLAISEKMRAQIIGLSQGIRNISDGISLANVADGYLDELASMTHRIRELSVQASNDTYGPEERAIIQLEIDQLVTEIDDITERAEFNGIKLFRGAVTNEIYAEPQYQTVYDADPAYIFADLPFDGPVTVAGGTSAEINTSSIIGMVSHLNALDVGPNFPLEGLFVIQVSDPLLSQNPSTTNPYAAILDFSVLNKDGNFSLQDFEDFFNDAFAAVGAAAGSAEPIAKLAVLQPSGHIEVKATALGGTGSSITLGQNGLTQAQLTAHNTDYDITPGYNLSSNPPKYANSSIFGASTTSANPTTPYNVTGNRAITADEHPISDTLLWSLIPDDTQFTFRVVEKTWYAPNTPQNPSSTGRWDLPEVERERVQISKGELSTFMSVAGYPSTVAGANQWLSERSAVIDGFDNLAISASYFVDRNGLVRITITDGSVPNQSKYPADQFGTDKRYEKRWLPTYGIQSAVGNTSTDLTLPFARSSYPLVLSENIGTFEITLRDFFVPVGDPNAIIPQFKLIVDFDANTVSLGGTSLPFSTNEQLVSQLNILLNSITPAPAAAFPYSAGHQIHEYPTALASIDASGRLVITSSEQRIRIEMSESQSDRPILLGAARVASGTNMSTQIKIDGTPSKTVNIIPGEYVTIGDFIKAHYPLFLPEYELGKDDNTPASIIIKSVATGDSVNPTGINFNVSPLSALSLASEVFRKLGFENPTFRRGVTYDPYEEQLPLEVIGFEMGHKLLWIQGRDKNGLDQGLYIHLPYISASSLKLTEYVIPRAALEEGYYQNIGHEYQENISVLTREDANTALDTINYSLDILLRERARFGAVTNAMEHMQSNVINTNENLMAAESRIRDTDMASTMVEYTKNSILTQSAQAMLVHANQLPQGILQLLQ